ncbi:hypothetical protein TREMEDRAFT_18577, partial [Tremella mesenterica DSM 1558]|uniref:uncharacterized protein n=1 Tax=Tremella mesenterica (strain ATCC 24925 / CBS 8224 / DSM 1558 / NBRC 9311 / NRRL Y-6157 / RJB 2259-6 / UBC 559-6) TaxID=578456 RepID=UPI0003F4A220
PTRKKVQDDFSVDQIPTKSQLWEAAMCFVRDEEGQLVPFQNLFPLTETTYHPPKTIVFFIRHFWCGQCQDYTLASLGLLDPDALARKNIRVVVISNGSWKIIKAYRKVFNCPFPIYVDGPRRLYGLLG